MKERFIKTQKEINPLILRNTFKDELQNIISGIGSIAKRNTMQTKAHYPDESKNTSADAQNEEFIKE